MRISRDSPLLLASSSPRRRELLALARVSFEVIVSHADESIAPEELPLTYVARVARAKLEGTVLDAAARARGAAVLAADTIVVAEGRVFGKPRDDDDARRMLRVLQGGSHEVATAFAVGVAEGNSVAFLAETTVRTTVTFRALSSAEIEGYVATGEGRDKAGAYAMQGMASAFVLRIDGSPTNVIGLPVAEVVMELRRLELL